MLLALTHLEGSQQYTRNTKMRIWSENPGHWARCIHTPNSVHNWGYGERSTNFLHWSAWQTACSHTKEKSPTVSLWAGSDVNSPSPSSKLPWCACIRGMIPLTQSLPAQIEGCMPQHSNWTTDW